jgi:hypothetical protein
MDGKNNRKRIRAWFVFMDGKNNQKRIRFLGRGLNLCPKNELITHYSLLNQLYALLHPLSPSLI